MQNSFMFGVSVGESFAEYILWDGSKTIAAKRAYLSRENLKNSLQQFVSAHKDKVIAKTFVSLRISDRLMDYKLSGAVAHVTTEGFENWLELRGCSGSALTSEELHFSVRERIQASGQVIQPLANEELESIAAKLELMKIKKVCLHFLHATINPAHEKQAQEFFQSKNIEVFIPEKTENQDEVTRWRKNALNATISSLFQDLKKDLLEALKDAVTEDKVYFVGAEGEVFQNENHKRVGSLFASYSALGFQYQDAKTDVLHLGLEDFVLISPQSWSEIWESPWGKVENRSLKIRQLAVQPTQGLELNDFNHFDFNQRNEGWEPGPMSFGRGQKPTLMDLWTENAKLGKLDGLQDRMVPAGIQKFKNSLLTLIKASYDRNLETAAVIKELQSLGMQKIVMESLMHRQNKKVKVTGPLADLFANGFKKDPNASFDNEDFAEARAVIAVGTKAAFSKSDTKAKV
ncbi:hydantoinase/oxoprolinase N-terminal domain-containing protein [Bdellovibrio sp. HCB185ZH]|uniref:hydantoinase/oxoprolinase N-terminal domain-containing protein n=1 Tax=Bdellovibrio sp. HCB185ZH TaxID=3394235 RepID=UPI0039A469F2